MAEFFQLLSFSKQLLLWLQIYCSSRNKHQMALLYTMWYSMHTVVQHTSTCMLSHCPFLEQQYLTPWLWNIAGSVIYSVNCMHCRYLSFLQNWLITSWNPILGQTCKHRPTVLPMDAFANVLLSLGYRNWQVHLRNVQRILKCSLHLI